MTEHEEMARRWFTWARFAVEECRPDAYSVGHLVEAHMYAQKHPEQFTPEALKEMHDSGKVRMVGISNANTAQIRQARDILGSALVSVQNQYSPRFRSSEPELRLCDELGLAFLPWSPLGGSAQARRMLRDGCGWVTGGRSVTGRRWVTGVTASRSSRRRPRAVRRRCTTRAG